MLLLQIVDTQILYLFNNPNVVTFNILGNQSEFQSINLISIQPIFYYHHFPLFTIISFSGLSLIISAFFNDYSSYFRLIIPLPLLSIFSMMKTSSYFSRPGNIYSMNELNSSYVSFWVSVKPKPYHNYLILIYSTSVISTILLRSASYLFLSLLF